MRGRELGEPLTVVTEFTVRAHTEEFERALRHHSQYLRRRKNFGFLVTARFVERPQVYLLMGHWRTRRHFLRTVRDRKFLDHVSAIGPMADTEADQAVSVARVLRDRTEAGTAGLLISRVVVSRDRPGFEERFAELSESLAQQRGFGGSDLLRSTVRPYRYTVVQWWRDTEHCTTAMRGEAYGRWRAGLSSLADITTERALLVAYERVLE